MTGFRKFRHLVILCHQLTTVSLSHKEPPPRGLGSAQRGLRQHPCSTCRPVASPVTPIDTPDHTASILASANSLREGVAQPHFGSHGAANRISTAGHGRGTPHYAGPSDMRSSFRRMAAVKVDCSNASATRLRLIDSWATFAGTQQAASTPTASRAGRRAAAPSRARIITFSIVVIPALKGPLATESDGSMRIL